MADKSLRGKGMLGRRAGPTRKVGKGYRIDSSISPVAKSRVIDRMKEEAKALGGSFFTAEEMEAKIKKMKKKTPYGGEKI